MSGDESISLPVLSTQTATERKMQIISFKFFAVKGYDL